MDDDARQSRFWKRIGLKWGILLVLSGVFLWVLPFVPAALNIPLEYEAPAAPFVVGVGIVLFVCGAIAVYTRFSE